MPMCPNGDQSTTDDWCDVCGARMAAPPAPPYGSRPAPSSSSSSPASTPPSSLSPPGFATEPAVAELCPQCRTPREGVALFCEECRYNFRTHTPTLAPVTPPPPPAAPDFQQPERSPYESPLSGRSEVNRPAEPVPSGSVTVTSGSGDYLIEPPSTPVRPPDSGAGTGSSGPSAASGQVGQASYVSSSTSASSGSPEQAPGKGTAWVAVIAADREYFTAMMARSGPEGQNLYFPAFSPEVELPLTGHQITIGRRRHSTGEAPDIDLSRAPEDPGVSHQHAVLVQQPDGSWSVVDQDSTNGTSVNLGEDPIRAYTPVPLDEGDRVHVGAWTTITVRRV